MVRFLLRLKFFSALISTEHFKFLLIILGTGSALQSQHNPDKDIGYYALSGSNVPAPPQNMAVGGKASLLPKRTPVSDREIEAILVSKTVFLSGYSVNSYTWV
ncbi:hypothetical protein Csa_000203 [Cucumis sativus]|nr:hypothetical protein Csa_000203 [Cucumis sativus]